MAPRARERGPIKEPAIATTASNTTHTHTAPAIAAQNLSRIYIGKRNTPDRLALDQLSLTIPPGAFVALLGPNGAGKSTFLRILATLDAPTSGAISLLGHALTSQRNNATSSIRARLGVVFQTVGLDPLLTVAENLNCQASLFAIGRDERRRRIEAIAREFEIADRLHDRVSSLSGGLARRVDLARALLSEPDLLLLDEPTTGLDHEARTEFLELLANRRAASPTLTIIMSTHLMDEAERADRVVMLSEGRLVADGAPDELRRSLGAAAIRCDASFADELEALGLTLTHGAGPSRLVAVGDPETVQRAAESLIRRGASLQVGPPSLGDVYLARAGKRLSDAPVRTSETESRTRRRKSRTKVSAI